MANTHETDRPGLTAGEAVRELFAQPPAPGRDIVWLADQVLSIAQHIGSVKLRRTQDEAESTLVCHTDSAEQVITGRDPLRLFRPLLARFAVLGADETGSEPQLYGGKYALVRSSRTGPVRLDVDFTNTPDRQCISIIRVPVAITPRTGSALDAGIADPAPQPSI